MHPWCHESHVHLNLTLGEETAEARFLFPRYLHKFNTLNIVNMVHYLTLNDSKSEYMNVQRAKFDYTLVSLSVALLHEWADPDRTGHGLGHSQNPQGVQTLRWLQRQERIFTLVHTCSVVFCNDTPVCPVSNASNVICYISGRTSLCASYSGSSSVLLRYFLIHRAQLSVVKRNN